MNYHDENMNYASHYTVLDYFYHFFSPRHHLSQNNHVYPSEIEIRNCELHRKGVPGEFV